MKYTLQNLIATLEWLNDEAGCPEAYSKVGITELAHDALEALQASECFSCGVDTIDIDEYYAVQKELWKTYGVEGMLCIGCLEVRLGRKLVPADFIDVPANKPHLNSMSDRLKDRLGW